MKRFVLAAAALALSAAAQAENYIGGAFGPSEVETSCDLPYNDCESGDTGFKIYGGMMMGGTSLPGFSLELGYTDFGQASKSATAFGVTAYTRTIEASALSFGAAIHPKLANSLAGVVRLGLAYVSAEGRGGANTSASDSKLTPILGLGLEYNINRQFKLIGNADFTSYDTGKESGSARLLSIGAQMGF